jgi:hypothetical protein
VNDDSTIGRSVALLAAGTCGRDEELEPGVAERADTNTSDADRAERADTND